MAYNPNLISRNIRDLEYNKYTEILNDSRFPAVTSVLVGYDAEDGIQTNVYNKTAELMYLVNASDINQNITLSATNIQISNVGISGVAAVSGTVAVSSISQPVPIQTNTNVQAVSSGITNWDVLSAAIPSNYGTFTQLPAANARSVTINNISGGVIWIKRFTGGGVAVPVPNSSAINLTLVNNTSEVAIMQANGSTANVYALYQY